MLNAKNFKSFNGNALIVRGLSHKRRVSKK